MATRKYSVLYSHRYAEITAVGEGETRVKTEALPLVSVLTPVYNGADYLDECIESVLAQTYPHWQHTIVNNCSTDESLAIARRYARQDPRIRVVSNARFLSIIENHNEAIRQIPPESKYCKFVYADDWLYPTCIEELVCLAEENSTVGLVSAYTTDGRAVQNALPRSQSIASKSALNPRLVIPGKDICRSTLLGGDYAFGTMTALLLRCELVRKRVVFFNEPHLHADLEACLDVLTESEFGFVRQVLSYSRPREQSTSSFTDYVDGITLGQFVVFLKYGRVFLDDVEYRKGLAKARGRYYRRLAHNLLRLRGQEFWKYHVDTLAAFSYQMNWWLLSAATLVELSVQLLHPINAVRRGRSWWRRSLEGALGWRGRLPKPESLGQ